MNVTMRDRFCADAPAYVHRMVSSSHEAMHRQKHSSWAYYVAYLSAEYRMPPLLLIVCQDEKTARWANKPYHLGAPLWPTLTVRPLVLGPHNMPVITEVAAAAEDIPVAAFSAITHSRHPQADTMLRALSDALRKADPDTADIFKEITELGLGGSPAAGL
ncbi:hypothetical protein V2S66_06920 [Streptomyces sp. V4-01]|uniref:Uncharacterized protein n=1 Tax=Actinacidiphila polyblastidii TaxID=3110430 RepID=A0ABU7P9C9_9ACTN|nr:hypothetical protein [Streptomyces sp. V4-01]